MVGLPKHEKKSSTSETAYKAMDDAATGETVWSLDLRCPADEPSPPATFPPLFIRSPGQQTDAGSRGLQMFWLQRLTLRIRNLFLVIDRWRNFSKKTACLLRGLRYLPKTRFSQDAKESGNERLNACSVALFRDSESNN